MSDIKKTFHETAVESILFKGRQDWYFCYLKAERIAHVLVLLGEKVSPANRAIFGDLISEASDLPHTIAHFVAGEVDVQILLADLFSLLSSVRLSGTRAILSKETATLIAGEYELITEKIAAGNRLSPFVSRQDLSVPDILLERQTGLDPLPLTAIPGNTPARPAEVRDSQKRPAREVASAQGPSGRSEAILHFVLQSQGASIKDICQIVPDCSEKTVQRELAALINQGLIKREGERRWSVYKPA